MYDRSVELSRSSRSIVAQRNRPRYRRTWYARIIPYISSPCCIFSLLPASKIANARLRSRAFVQDLLKSTSAYAFASSLGANWLVRPFVTCSGRSFESWSRSQTPSPLILAMTSGSL